MIAPNDHYAGNYTALMQNFAINGAAVVATPATVRAQVVEATAQQKAVGLVAFVNGKLQPFFLPFIIKPALGVAEDATLTSFGPYAVGDLDTETVRTRKVCIMPAKYLGYFLSHEDGVEPRQFLEKMHPVIKADGNAIALEPFITFTISSMTKTLGQGGQGPGPSAVLVAAPASVARNKTLLAHSQFILHSHLTSSLV